MAIHPTTHAHPRPRQPRALVHTRPLETGAFVLAHRDFDPHVFYIPIRPGRFALAITTRDEQRDTNTGK
jgi:hypothetical protein